MNQKNLLLKYQPAKVPVEYNKMEEVKIKILSSLAYFHMFSYPLTQREIYNYLTLKCSYSAFEEALEELLTEKKIFRTENVYSITDTVSLLDKRNTGNEKAQALLVKAKKVAALLSNFPYVRGVAISGSLSKNFATDKSDIDFFIITKKNRLWIARTSMHLLKKISFLFNKQHLLCMNYYVDEAEMEIIEKNIFTATEILTLLPCEGTALFEEFFKRNNWVRSVFPNQSLRIATGSDIRPSLLKKLAEFCFNNSLGNRLDDFLMQLTAKRWHTKTKKQIRNENGVVLSLMANKHYAKPNPKEFQEKILQRFKQNQFKTGDQEMVAVV